MLALVAAGKTNAEIGQALYIGEATVKTHLLHVFVKLEVDDRTAAVTTAIGRGLLPALAGPTPPRFEGEGVPAVADRLGPPRPLRPPRPGALGPPRPRPARPPAPGPRPAPAPRPARPPPGLSGVR